MSFGPKEDNSHRRTAGEAAEDMKNTRNNALVLVHLRTTVDNIDLETWSPRHVMNYEHAEKQLMDKIVYNECQPDTIASLKERLLARFEHAALKIKPLVMHMHYMLTLYFRDTSTRSASLPDRRIDLMGCLSKMLYQICPNALNEKSEQSLWNSINLQEFMTRLQVWGEISKFVDTGLPREEWVHKIYHICVEKSSEHVYGPPCIHRCIQSAEWLGELFLPVQISPLYECVIVLEIEDFRLAVGLTDTIQTGQFGLEPDVEWLNYYAGNAAVMICEWVEKEYYAKMFPGESLELPNASYFTKSDTIRWKYRLHEAENRSLVISNPGQVASRQSRYDPVLVQMVSGFVRSLR